MKKENKAQARQKKAQAKKMQALKKKILIIGGIVLAVVLVVVAVVAIKASNDAANAPSTLQLSKYLTKEGYVKGIDIEDYVELCDLESTLQIAAADITPTDEEVLAAMESALSDHEELITEEGTVLEDGDKINLDYVGYVDGVAFDGGNTNGSGTTLTLGSGSYIDDFEDQLVGHKVGEEVSVEVTFPDDYSNTDLAGKDAVFEVVINGVYVLELTDELVAEYVTGCSTVEEYEETVRQSMYDYYLEQTVWSKVAENSTINEYPEKYANNLASAYSVFYEEQFIALNQSYYESYGYYPYESITDYYGMTEDELISYISYYAGTDVTFCLLCQAIYEQEGLSYTEEDKTAFVEGLGYEAEDMASAIEAYGEGYIAQGAISNAVGRYLQSITVVTE